MHYNITRVSIVKKYLFLAAAIVSLLLSACAKGSSENNLALISFTHASPGLPPIDIYLGGNRINGDSIIAYNDTIPYRIINSGVSNIMVKKNISSITYISRNIELDPSSHNSFFIAGTPDSVTYVVTRDQIILPQTGKAKLRFLNLIPDSKPLDIKITAANSLFAGIAFKSYTDFTQIDPGTYKIQILEQGNATPIVEKTVVIDEGRFCTIWARGIMRSSENETSADIGVVILK